MIAFRVALFEDKAEGTSGQGRGLLGLLFTVFSLGL